ncbi:hypothetical protein RFI_27194 [Reticulomyxa filosa]|uniref:Uncharacterized protein n=1 Tax=Reticulomyxa filosa TaxID=46433 RepID=X6M872_RETFI|nr:hypothetical protein RFI_27194 [Reticulomyxa filosa]|eukprot:ETO10183.1 hypothetical protein RFI_27194 [Reticulomyxa filosa]
MTNDASTFVEKETPKLDLTVDEKKIPSEPKQYKKPRNTKKKLCNNELTNDIIDTVLKSKQCLRNRMSHVDKRETHQNWNEFTNKASHTLQKMDALISSLEVYLKLHFLLFTRDIYLSCGSNNKRKRVVICKSTSNRRKKIARNVKSELKTVEEQLTEHKIVFLKTWGCSHNTSGSEYMTGSFHDFNKESKGSRKARSSFVAVFLRDKKQLKQYNPIFSKCESAHKDECYLFLLMDMNIM